MTTELLYFKDTYLFKTVANFVEMRENEKGRAVILDKTIFYPQGGGQPTDSGYIRSASAVFKVTFVGLDPDGIVWHFGEFEKGTFKDGEGVSLEIDKKKRELHARIHSGGHLIDCAVQDMGTEVTLEKGFHFIDGPYVEGNGEVEDTEAFRLELEAKVNQLIGNQLIMRKEMFSEEDAKNKNISAPPGKSVRVVGFDGHESCGCGGTHVNNSGDIGHITIRKVTSKKGRTKISYTIDS